MRFLLPLSALAILSTLFLFGRAPENGTPEIPYADVDAQDLVQNPRMTQPEYATVTADGAEINLIAQEVTPDHGDGGAASGLQLSWRSAEGLAANLTAPDVDFDNGTISMSGGVRMTTSSGWALTSPRIDAATDRSVITAPETVTGFAPFGELQAGAMTLSAGENPDSHVLNFNGGVRLIYQP